MVLDDLRRCRFRIGDASVMRRDPDLWMGPEWVVLRQRFLPKDVQLGEAQLVGIKRGYQVFFYHMPAARDIDDAAAVGHHAERAGTQYSLCIRRQRQ